MDKNKLEKQAIGIISQLFDLAEVPIEKRQQINDKAYDYMLEQLRFHSVSRQSEQLLEEQSNWLMVNTSLEVENIVDFKEHFK